MNREWLFIHGWGYDASAWDSWLERLHPEDTVACFDRGYFGKPTHAAFTTSKPRILVTHSLGQSFYDPETMGVPDVWVLISGFERFADNDSERRVTRTMRQRLVTHSAEVLAAFYANCGDAERPVPPNPDTERLTSDLILLEESEASISVMRQCRKMVILHTRHDRIVPIERVERLGFPVVIHPGGAHSFPFLEPQWCLEILKPLSV